MPDYHYQTREFGLSEEAVHLLRNSYNYKSYKYSDIANITIGKGKGIKNWMVVLVIGIALVLFAIWYTLGIFGIISNKEVRVIYIEEIIVPLFPFLVGFYCIYVSTKTETVVRLKMTDNKVDSLPLKEIEKSGKLSDFQDFLENRRRNR